MASSNRRPVRALAAAAAMALCCSSAQAVPASPHPPCESAPFPSYAAADAPPAMHVWSDATLRGWVAPVCTGWGATSFTSLVALAGTFHHQGGIDGLLERLGAVSARRGIQYWSTTDQAWRVLVIDAAALDGPDAKRRRPDFSLAEMMAGADLYFVQSDSRSSGETIYRMRVGTSGRDRLVVETENVTRVKWHFVTLFPPGAVKAATWMERQSPGIWSNYSLSGTTDGASWLALGHDESYVNRAVAIYRHLLGIPTDREPPLARTSGPAAAGGD
jgi:hypothetical protein